MMTIRFTRLRRTGGRAASPRLLCLAAGSALLVTVGCDDLLQVTDPDVANPESLTGEAALPALFAGALSDFQVGYSGSSNGDGQVTISGLLSDELYNSESFPTRIEIDQRRMRDDNGTLRGVFLDMQQARAAAERAARRYAEFQAGTEDHAHMLNIAGLSYVTFGENYCSGVPFSTLEDDGTITFGTQQTTPEMFQTAVDKFDEALGMLEGDEDQYYLAQIGKGRALLNLGQFAAAATAVEGVPDDFVYLIEHSENSGRQQNPVFTLVNVSRRFSVPDAEGGNGVNFRTAGDPRVPVQLNPVNPIGLDNETPSYIPLKYTSRGSDVPVATGIEAALIRAEAELQEGNYLGAGGTLEILNDLRADMAPEGTTLTPLVAVTDPDDQVNQLFYERAFWLYLTSHRLGDMRRLIRQYSRGIETVFPTDDYHKTGSLPYGPDVNLPLPDDERNNPEVTAPQCIDRDP